jgi:hypothetical protein
MTEPINPLYLFLTKSTNSASFHFYSGIPSTVERTIDHAADIINSQVPDPIDKIEYSSINTSLSLSE